MQDWNQESKWQTVTGLTGLPTVGDPVTLGGGKLFVEGPLEVGAVIVNTDSYLELRNGASLAISNSAFSGSLTLNSAAAKLIGNATIDALEITLDNEGGIGTRLGYHITPDSDLSVAPIFSRARARLGGALDIVLDGVTMEPGTVIPFMEASAFGNSFTTVTLSGSSVLPGQTVTATYEGSGSRRTAHLVFDQKLLMTVDRETGNVSISNAATTPISISQYTLNSDADSIVPSNFNGLGPEWTDISGPDTSIIEQQHLSAAASFSDGTPVSLGAIYALPTAPTEFGVPYAYANDFDFSYVEADGQITTGVVEYVNTKHNNLVLTIDSMTGMAAIQNESEFSVDIVGYTITSAAGRLDVTGESGPEAWNSLSNQGVEGGTWVTDPGSNSPFRITELQGGSASIVTTMSSLRTLELGKLYEVFSSSAPSDVTFEFLRAGETSPMTGIVVFGDLSGNEMGLEGDFNGDGFVNLADYTVWRDNLGASEGALLSNNGTGGIVDSTDYDLWKLNFGRSQQSSQPSTLGGNPIPEPTSLAFLAGLLGTAISNRRWHIIQV